MTALCSIEMLNRCDVQTFVDRVGDVFEHAPWIAQAVAHERPFQGAEALHAAMMAQVNVLPEDALIALLSGHPELGGPDARAGKMTASSVHEQGQLALDQLSKEQAAQWDVLNKAYRARFGFPFILCVSRHSRSSVLRTFQKRLHASRQEELTQALTEIARITRLRLATRIVDHGMLHLTGVLSTHVLDTTTGRPAVGIRFTLYEISDDESEKRLLVDTLTDDRGRTPKPLISGVPLRIGRYELRFYVGEYFRREGVIQSDWPFLDIVPIQFSIADPEGNYHVPLTTTPWAYATYRGQ